ncbi:hypothetical protein [Kineococcus aurantiacus]|uniref:Uncharacterized protein n=1 Tax=Kineococcus aurantiacus TaxID=37633 RepID=A0A7Y9DQN5_9ACTN|nr:hypothetical protein [Kineococcus aurantiacus]NYD24766.1 hypothetical protein [Kineococcus aurantiacus]
MATTRRTHCAKTMPWPAGNHRSLERFLDDAERAGTLDIVADHPAAATALALPPHGLDAATVGTVLRYAESPEQGRAFPAAWARWQEATDGQFADRAASADAFAEFAQALTPEHWDTRDGEPVEEVLLTFVDAAVAARADGTSPRDAVNALTGATPED